MMQKHGLLKAVSDAVLTCLLTCNLKLLTGEVDEVPRAGGQASGVRDMQRATRPKNELLISSAPLKFWEEAERQAFRSPLSHHSTGAVIFDKRGRILSKGCSHVGDNRHRWTHAEEFACSRMWPAYESLDAHCIIVTLTKGGGWAWSSRPCAMCLNMLNHYNIQYATYAERCNDGSWEIQSLIVPDMMHKVKEVDLSARYAKAMRV